MRTTDIPKESWLICANGARSSKLQTPKKLQIPSTKTSISRRRYEPQINADKEKAWPGSTNSDEQIKNARNACGIRQFAHFEFCIFNSSHLTWSLSKSATWAQSRGRKKSAFICVQLRLNVLNLGFGVWDFSGAWSFANPPFHRKHRGSEKPAVE